MRRRTGLCLDPSIPHSVREPFDSLGRNLPGFRFVYRMEDIDVVGKIICQVFIISLNVRILRQRDRELATIVESHPKHQVADADLPSITFTVYRL